MIEELLHQEVRKEYVVSLNKTAKEVGSGGLEVLASPEIIRLVENITFEWIQSYLDKENTTVGGYIDINHLTPTFLNKDFSITISLDNIENKKLTFSYSVYENDKLAANGKHVRFIVNIEKFINK